MIDGFIIICGSTNDLKGNISNVDIGRLEKGLKLLRQNKNYKIILTGGIGPHFNQTDKPYAYYAKKYLLNRGVCESDIMDLVLSIDTVEDAKLSKIIVDNYNVSKVIVLTSDFHMERVKYIFDKIYSNLSIKYEEFEYKDSEEVLNSLKKIEMKELELLKSEGRSSLGSTLENI